MKYVLIPSVLALTVFVMSGAAAPRHATHGLKSTNINKFQSASQNTPSRALGGPLSCVCGSAFYYGDEVTLIVDNPEGARWSAVGKYRKRFMWCDVGRNRLPVYQLGKAGPLVTTVTICVLVETEQTKTITVTGG